MSKNSAKQLYEQCIEWSKTMNVKRKFTPKIKRESRLDYYKSVNAKV